MYEFHKDKDEERYFGYQYLTARDHILPFVLQVKPMDEIRTVLEIGCGEAGVLKAFVEAGCRCMGIELSESRMQKAIIRHSDAITAGQITFLNKDIYEVDPDHELPFKFDLIVLKDVIEHIPRQEIFIPRLAEFLSPDGVIFFGFPPWQMPFGGHQQICESKLLSRWPYVHLLPRGIYAKLLRMCGEPDYRQIELLEIRDTGLSIGQFERILRSARMQVLRRTLWLLNPIYRYKFGKGPIKQFAVVGAIPFMRNFFTTAAYYVVRPVKGG